FRRVLFRSDHVDLVLDNAVCLRFNAPRRFGSLLWPSKDPLEHPLLAALAPEPLSDEFNAAYLARALKGRRVAIKQAIMNSQVVVGVGNIYASRHSFALASVHAAPQVVCDAKRLKRSSKPSKRS